MRVIETFVKYVPREKIPADAKWFMQDIYGELKCSTSPVMPYYGGFSWIRGEQCCGVEFSLEPLSSDAAETVVTREELMRAYDLVEQGYTLWFGGECPVEQGALVDVVFRNAGPSVTPENGHSYVWLDRNCDYDIIAYRLSRSVDKDATPVLKVDSEALEARLKKLDDITGGVWPVSDDEKLLVTADNQLIRFEPEKLITRAQRDDYISRKIRVGDKVKTDRNIVVTVLFIGEKTAFVKFQSGAEMAINLSSLTRIPQ